MKINEIYLDGNNGLDIEVDKRHGRNSANLYITSKNGAKVIFEMSWDNVKNLADQLQEEIDYYEPTEEEEPSDEQLREWQEEYRLRDIEYSQSRF